MDSKPTTCFDSFAQVYASNRHASRMVVEHVGQRVANRDVSTILEIGCGTADHLAALAAELTAAGHGFDCSREMLKQANQKHPALNLANGNAEGPFPYAAESFDVCFSVNVVHHVNNLDELFGEALRVTKPGGVIVTVTDSEEDIRQRTMSRYFPEIVPIELGRYPPICEIVSAMGDAGWTNVEVTHVERSFPLSQSFLDQCQSRAFSVLRLLPDKSFKQGLQALKAALANPGGAKAEELYTFVWGNREEC